MPRESKASKTARAHAVVDALARAYPKSRCALRHDSPFQLLVATVLSAQTTDIAVNRVTLDLFARWPTAHDLAHADVTHVGQTINSIGLWRAKATHIVGLAQALVRDHDGDVPRDLNALVALPGVGRKTATAVLGTAFGDPAGLTVDTHMLRIHDHLRLSRAKSAEIMARELEALLPKDAWNAYTHRIIDHGRLVCVARRPRCGVCPLTAWCPSAYHERVGYRPENDVRVPASAKGLSWLAWEGASKGEKEGET